MFLAHSSHSVKDEQIHEMSFFSARFKNFVFSYEVQMGGEREGKMGTDLWTLCISLCRYLWETSRELYAHLRTTCAKRIYSVYWTQNNGTRSHGNNRTEQLLEFLGGIGIWGLKLYYRTVDLAVRFIPQPCQRPYVSTLFSILNSTPVSSLRLGPSLSSWTHPQALSLGTFSDPDLNVSLTSTYSIIDKAEMRKGFFKVFSIQVANFEHIRHGNVVCTSGYVASYS